MPTDIRTYSLSEFVNQYLPAQQPKRSIKATVLHHTWKPTAASYNGLSTVQGIRRYHMARKPDGRGWRDIGANAYAAPDQKVYNGRPLSDTNYAHAQISRSWNEVPRELRLLAYPDKGWLNKYGFGIETIGNFDYDGQPIDPLPLALATSFDVLAAVHKQYDIPVEHLFLHRDVANKSCPGERITRQWAQEQLRQRMDEEPQYVRFIEHSTGELIGSVKLVPGGDHWAGQKKFYIKRPDWLQD